MLWSQETIGPYQGIMDLLKEERDFMMAKKAIKETMTTNPHESFFDSLLHLVHFSNDEILSFKARVLQVSNHRNENQKQCTNKYLRNSTHLHYEVNFTIMIR